MKTGHPSATARITAIIRAVESARPLSERIIFDPYARLFIHPIHRLILKNRLLTRIAVWTGFERRFPGGVDTILLRIRYVDDCLAAALKQGLEQVVILGAGYDSRAQRLVDPAGRVKVFEVDHPDTQQVKKKRIKTLLPHIIHVPVDFEREWLGDGLSEHGFNVRGRSFFIWEGVAKYLTRPAVEKVLRYIGNHASAGSQVVFDYLFRSMVNGNDKTALTERVLAYQKKINEPYLFGIDPGDIQAYLSSMGFSRTVTLTMPNLKTRFFQSGERGALIHDYMGVALATV